MVVRVLVAIALFSLPAAAWSQPAAAVAAAGEWVREAERHQPGTIDEPLVLISGWSADKLEQVRRGLRKYLLLARWDDVDRENRVFQRGALLHADIAILAPVQARKYLGSPTSYTSVTRSLDGERQADEMVTGHWAFARMLLDEVRPDPSGDETVRRWYVAVASFLHVRAQLGVASPHLARAREVLRGDPDILFFSGAMHEAFASSRYQAVMRTAGASRHRGAGIDRSRAELRRAEGFYRRAIERRPDFVEAQIRLGRVLGQLGRHQDAVAQLAAVSALLPKTERLLQYYAQMFLGHEEAALGRRDAARANFQAAAALYPTAQSPLLALSELARRYGDRQGAGGATRALAALPSDEELREEPWWVYTLAQGRHVDVRLAELRRPFRHPPAPERP